MPVDPRSFEKSLTWPEPSDRSRELAGEKEADREQRFRKELADPRRAAPRPSSDELIEAVRYATREGVDSRADRRRAWARFAAAGMFEIDTTEKAAEWADRMLVEYDKRFPQ